MTARDGGEVVVLLLLLWMSSDGGGVLLLRQPLAMIVVHPDRLLTADRWGRAEENSEYLSGLFYVQNSSQVGR